MQDPAELVWINPNPPSIALPLAPPMQDPAELVEREHTWNHLHQRLGIGLGLWLGLGWGLGLGLGLGLGNPEMKRRKIRVGWV